MRKLYVTILILLAIVSGIVSGVYFTKTANNLPHFLPGYSQSVSRKHTKHGLAFAGLAVILVIGAWMVSGSEASSPKTTDQPTDNTNNKDQ